MRLLNAKGVIHATSVMGKARLAPLEEVSIPRLELAVAALSVTLSYYWADSLSVLKCMNNQTKRFHTFESNCFSVIHDGSSRHQ